LLYKNALTALLSVCCYFPEHAHTRTIPLATHLHAPNHQQLNSSRCTRTALRVETAKSGRSKCAQTGNARKCGEKEEKKGDFIAKGEVRIGSINTESGT
jgi:hypothetical protein